MRRVTLLALKKYAAEYAHCIHDCEWKVVSLSYGGFLLCQKVNICEIYINICYICCKYYRNLKLKWHKTGMCNICSLLKVMSTWFNKIKKQSETVIHISVSSSMLM